MARYRNHLRFNLHCKHHDVTPVSLKLRTTITGKKVDNILKKTEKQLLNVRIGQTVKKLKDLEERSAEYDRQVFSQIPDKHEEVIAHITSAQKKEHQISKQRQQNKFKRLENKSMYTDKQPKSLANEVMSRWVQNCSQRILSDPEMSF